MLYDVLLNHNIIDDTVIDPNIMKTFKSFKIRHEIRIKTQGGGPGPLACWARNYSNLNFCCKIALQHSLIFSVTINELPVNNKELRAMTLSCEFSQCDRIMNC